jgi:hypothetical protein
VKTLSDYHNHSSTVPDLALMFDDLQAAEDEMLNKTPINRFTGDEFMRKLDLCETTPEE